MNKLRDCAPTEKKRPRVLFARFAPFVIVKLHPRVSGYTRELRPARVIAPTKRHYFARYVVWIIRRPPARQHAIFRTGQQPPNCSVSWRESRELFPYRPPRPINHHSLPLRLTTSDRDKRAERTNVVQTKLSPPPKNHRLQTANRNDKSRNSRTSVSLQTT